MVTIIQDKYVSIGEVCQYAYIKRVTFVPFCVKKLWPEVLSNPSSLQSSKMLLKSCVTCSGYTTYPYLMNSVSSEMLCYNIELGDQDFVRFISIGK